MSTTVPCTGLCGVENHIAGSSAHKTCQARTAAIARHPAGKRSQDVMADFGAQSARASVQSADTIKARLESASDPHSPDHDDDRTALYEASLLEPSASTMMSQAEILGLVSEPDGGATVDVRSQKAVTSGFAHSPYPERSKVVDVEDLDYDTIIEYAEGNSDIFDDDDQAYLGLWHNPEDSKVYLDVSVVCTDAAEARADCEVNDQIAFFDLQTFESVTVNPNATSGQNTEYPLTEAGTALYSQ